MPFIVYTIVTKMFVDKRLHLHRIHDHVCITLNPNQKNFISSLPESSPASLQRHHQLCSHQKGAIYVQSMNLTLKICLLCF